jgi:hypothetical protein
MNLRERVKRIIIIGFWDKQNLERALAVQIQSCITLLMSAQNYTLLFYPFIYYFNY